METFTLANGFIKVTGGHWLINQAQPVAFTGKLFSHRLSGWFAPDRNCLSTVTIPDVMYCSSKKHPFLTRIECAMPLNVMSTKLLLAPITARLRGHFLRLIPFSFQRGLILTECTQDWVVVATTSRTERVVLEEESTLLVRSDAIVAYTTRPPTAFCPKLKVTDLLSAKQRPKTLLLRFYGPGILWMEGV